MPGEIIRPLPLSLEDLYTGCTKVVKTSQKFTFGRIEKELQIQVVPGWKSGTRIRFAKAGDDEDGSAPKDIVFEVEEKAHPTFKRINNDLHINLKIPLVDALTNPASPSPSDPSPLPRTIRTLDSRTIPIPLPHGLVRPGQSTRIPDEGMPRRANGVTVGKGDLMIKWFIVYPALLDREQRRELRRILK